MKNNDFLDDEKNPSFLNENASDPGRVVFAGDENDVETENIEIEELFEDPTAPEKSMKNNDFPETEKSDENNTFSPETASTAVLQSVHNPEIVKKILKMEAEGFSGRRIHEEIGNEHITKEDVFAVIKHFRAWTQNRVDSGFSSIDEVGEAEKNLEFQTKIKELEKENTRNWNEKNDLMRELKTITAERDGLKKWHDQFGPELQARLDKAENESLALVNENADLKNRLEGNTSKLWQSGKNVADVYAEGRRAGIKEAAGKNEKETLHWSYYFMLVGSGVAGILIGSILTRLFS